MAIAPQMQPNDHTCVHTCLAMITGVPVEKLVERFGDEAIGFDQAATVLVEHGIFPIKTTDCPHPFMFEGAYMVACCSKNFAGLSHQLVVEASREGYVVHDPQKGRDGKLYWTGEDIMSGEMSKTEVLWLDYDILKDMDNKKRYGEA